MMNKTRCNELSNPRRDDIPEQYRTIMLTIFILCTIYTVSTLILFRFLQGKYYRLRARPFYLMAIASISGLAGGWGTVALREYVGRENYPCLVLLSLVYLVIPNAAGHLVINLLSVYSKIVFAREANRLNIEKIYDSAIVNRGQVENLKDVATALITRQSNLKNFRKSARINKNDAIHPEKVNQTQQTITQTQTDGANLSNGNISNPSSSNAKQKPSNLLESNSFKLSTELKHIDADGANDGTSRDAHFSSSVSFSGDSDGINNRFFILKAKTSRLYTFIIYLLLLIPFIILIFAYGFSKPYYMDDCNGCRLKTQEMILLLVPTSVICVVGVVSVRRLRHKPDPLGILQESYLAFLVTLILSIPAFTLVFIDPSGIDRKGLWTWDVLLAIVITTVHTIVCPLQIVITIAMTRAAVKNVELSRILEIPEGRALFAKHLIHEFSVENLKFWEEASSWRENYKENDEATQHKAITIYKTFIGGSAPLALNLPFDVVRSIDDGFKKDIGNISKNVFDGALKEIYHLLESDAYRRFSRTKKFKEFLFVHDFTTPTKQTNPTITALSIRSNKSLKNYTESP